MAYQEIRQPVVAGRFYEGSRKSLLRQIEGCFLHRLGPGKLPQHPPRVARSIVGAVSPHAGFMFSGPPAAKVCHALDREEVPEVIVIVGTKHSWEGPDLSVWCGGNWLTPLGEVALDGDLVNALTRGDSPYRPDTSAHYGEHSAEVQLPFLQYTYGDAMPSIVPISYGPRPAQEILESGRYLAEVLRGRSALLIASTDFTHYESQEAAQRKDRMVLDQIESLNAAGMLQVVQENAISMCGWAATAVVLEACKELCATMVEILGYTTSGDILQDYSSVVGYAAAVLKRG